MRIIFPDKAGGLPRKSMNKLYYSMYYMYVLNLFRSNGNAISFTGDTSVYANAFAISIDDKWMVMDYSDRLYKPDTYKLKMPIFKFHFSEGIHEDVDNLYPFTPVSFHNWDEYFVLEQDIQYDSNNELIVMRQKPYGNARVRRSIVREVLKTRYGKNVMLDVIDKRSFWQDINKCLLAVFVPGCRNDILDRGHIQYMAFGCCIISPKIITMLAYNRKLIPFHHYIQCKSDYSDIDTIIDWAKNNRDECRKIGNNAKALFNSTSTPSKLIKWVGDCLHAN